MRILIVEDEKKLADALVHILKKKGYDTDVSYDGETGLDNALTNIYDVIVLDRMLPILNGIEVIKEIRSNNVYTPVIFLTAIGSTNDRIEGLDAGADDYLVKPFSTDELLARIRALLRRKDKTVTDGTIVKAGKISYDPETMIMKTENADVKLTFKEGQLFELLAANKGKTISKEKIFDKIWGFNSESDSTIVEIYIHHLRKKIPENYCGLKIDTIRGIGYRLVETGNV